MAFTLQAFAEDTLSADITDSANSMTLTTGGFGTPTGEQMLVIDPDVASKREIVKCAIDGTAVTSMDRAQDGTAAVAHTSGAKIIMAFVPSHHEALKAGTDLNDNVITAAKLATKVKAGWDLLSATGTRASNTQMTIAGDITDRLWVGKPLELTDTTTKYFYVTSFSYSSPNTTINFTGGTDYVLEGNPTNIYGGLHASPVGFPGWFAYDPNATGFASLATETGRFSISNRTVSFTILIIGTSNAGTFTVDAPVTSAQLATNLVRVMDQGTSYVGRWVLSPSSVTLTIGKDFGGDGGFTSSGSANGKRLYLYNGRYEI